MGTDIDPAMLGAVAGAALSVAFDYIPRLKDWYTLLEPTGKRLVMLGMMALVAAVIFGLSCTNLSLPAVPSVTCDQGGAAGLVTVFFYALVGNQLAYLVAPKPAKSGSMVVDVGSGGGQ